MPNNSPTFALVRTLATKLPDVEESTTFGEPSFKLRGNLLTCLTSHKSAEPGSLAVRIDFDQRAELIAADPDIYYLTDHYVDYPVVLVRLERISRKALQDLLNKGWNYVNAKKTAVPRKKIRPKRSSRR